MGEQLEQITKILGGILAILTAFLALFGKLAEVRDKVLRPVWNRTRQPVLIGAMVLITVIIPDSLMVWLFLYVAAENADRIREATTFLSLTVELALVISGYTLVWGVWLYPRLRPWVTRQIRGGPGSSASRRPDEDGPVHRQPPEHKAGGAS